MKQLRNILRAPDRHWVGDGFPVRTLFAYDGDAERLSPFLLLDYAGPAEFSPTAQRRGVGEHPHRGFETVTIVYQGEVEHRDSSGGGGKIGPGDVQWMTAASGLVHEELHGHDFAQRGGTFEMVQLWVNLPAKDKKAPPRYQTLASADIPTVRIGDATVRVIAGRLTGVAGPAKTFTLIDVWDVRLPERTRTQLPVASGWTTMLVVLRGAVRIGDEVVVGSEVALFDRDGADVEVDAIEDTSAVLLAGAPIDEPIVGRGPFVMNTVGDIKQAMIDYQSGRMGHLS
jgi:redox-sensitive bicupin YhaK (pirin superfamily)